MIRWETVSPVLVILFFIAMNRVGSRWHRAWILRGYMKQLELDYFLRRRHEGNKEDYEVITKWFADLIPSPTKMCFSRKPLILVHWLDEETITKIKS